MVSLLKLACYLGQPLNFTKELTRSSIYADQTKTSKTRILKSSAGNFRDLNHSIWTILMTANVRKAPDPKIEGFRVL